MVKKEFKSARGPLPSRDPQSYQLLVAIGALCDEGVDPPFDLGQVERKVKELGTPEGGLEKEWWGFRNIRSRLAGLSRDGFVYLTKRQGKFQVYPTSRDLPYLGELVTAREELDPERHSVSLTPGKGAHKVLHFLSIDPVEHSRGRIEEVLEQTSVWDSSWRTGAAPLEKLLVAGLIDRPKRGSYKVTEAGREALKDLESGKRVTIPEEELNPVWVEHFTTHSW